jgi:hypothetical protein
MGFDAIFLGRADYEDKKKRMESESLEYIWRPSAKTLGTDIEIFTHILFDHYNQPKGFGFDVLNWQTENADKVFH